MTTLLAIDPGNTQSAFVVVDVESLAPMQFAKVDNDHLLHFLSTYQGAVYVEMIASYGMPVGAEVFETCVWIGRFCEAHAQVVGTLPQLVKRHPVKIHHCGSARAKDANITQALVDRFAAGQPNHGKGTKTQPGWFYGFRADVWQAYALAVYAADTSTPARPVETARAQGALL